MKKAIIFYVLILFYIINISATIEKIESISNGIRIHERDRFVNSVLQYNDRLFIHAMFSINEFKILPDGSLENIGFYETKLSTRIHIDIDKLYLFESNQVTSRLDMHIFDLRSQPMEKIALIDTGIALVGYSVIFNDQHVMISDRNRQRMVLVNKDTFIIDGYIDEYFRSYMLKMDSLLIHPSSELIDNQPVTRLIFDNILDENTLEREEISSVLLPGIAIKQTPKLMDNKVVFASTQGAVVVCVEDMINPFIEYFIPYEYLVNDVIYHDGLLYLSLFNGMLQVYRLDDDGMYMLIYEETEYFGSQGIFDRSMYISYPFLYMNCSYTTKVYDISDDFNVVYTYGKYNLPGTVLRRKDDIYFIDIDFSLAVGSDFTINKYDVYSILDDTLLCTIYFDDSYSINIDIVEDKLYVMGTDNIYKFFNIYQLSNKDPDLIFSKNLEKTSIDDFIVNGNIIFMQDYYPLQVLVYSFENNNLVYTGSFLGRIQQVVAGYIGDVLLNYHNNEVIFRDINDFENILLSTTISYSSMTYNISHLMEGYFALSSPANNNCFIFQYDIENKIVSQIGSLNRRDFSIYNGIISVEAFDTYLSEYYTVVGGSLRKIGEKEDSRSVQFTSFFPERNKMVQNANSGIWIYDIEYTVSENDPVVIPVPQTELLSNFPNPFNPETTIRFNIAVDSPVSIDIYNIRGQKVRRVFDGFVERGSHSVIWDGRDEEGRELGSGVYLYRMVTSEESMVRRMVLLR